MAAWSARHGPLVVVLWFAGTIGLLGLSLAAGGIDTLDVNNDPSGPARESREAYEVLGAGEPEDPSERVVVVIDGGPGAVTDPAFRADVAVARGISVTSGTITSAASIMIVVFAAFVTLEFVFVQHIGLGLAVAVFIDATIIRSVLLPASMTVLGDWNWWLPRWLAWLPNVTIEGPSSEPEEGLPMGSSATLRR